MLSNFGLGKEFLAEAMEYASNLINYFLSSTIKGKTPMEVWFGKSATDYYSLQCLGPLRISM